MDKAGKYWDITGVKFTKEVGWVDLWEHYNRDVLIKGLKKKPIGKFLQQLEDLNMVDKDYRVRRVE